MAGDKQGESIISLDHEVAGGNRLARWQINCNLSFLERFSLNDFSVGLKSSLNLSTGCRKYLILSVFISNLFKSKLS